MEKLSKEQIITSANKWFEDFLNEDYYDKFKDMSKSIAYRLSKDIVKEVKEAYRIFFVKTCKSNITKTCDCTILECNAFNERNVENYCTIVYRYILAKVVDGYFKAFDKNYKPVYNEFDETKYKWYGVDWIECDLPYEIFYDDIEYVYIPRLELLTDCMTVFVSSVPYDETHLSSIFAKLSELLNEYGYINAPYNDVMAKKID